MNTVLIIGAGCSAGSQGLPLDKDFLKTTSWEIKKTHFLEKVLKKIYMPLDRVNVVDPWENYRLEIVWSEIVANQRSPKIILAPDEIQGIYTKLKELAIDERRKNLQKEYYAYYYYQSATNETPYAYFFKFAEWELRKTAFEAYKRVLDSNNRRFYKKLIDLVSNERDFKIISFNYDTLIEQSLEENSYQYLLPYISSDQNIEIIKPHGSVNWALLRSSNYGRPDLEEHSFVLKNDLSWSEFGFYEHYFEEPAIVGLTDLKPEFNLENK